MLESVRDQLLRTRDMARRARRLADSVPSDADRIRLLRHAAELEAQAADLEQTPDLVAPPPPAVQTQMQVQQQQQTEAPQAVAPEEQKSKG